MDDRDDQENPAITRQTRIPPALLEEAAADARTVEAFNRKLYFVTIDRIQREMRQVNVPLGQRMAWAEHLAKYGKVGAQAPAAQGGIAGSGSGFSVNIVLNQPAQTALPKVEIVEAQPASPQPASDE